MSGAWRRAEQVWGEVGCLVLPLTWLGKGPGAGCLPPGCGSALTLRLVPLGLLHPPQHHPLDPALGDSELLGRASVVWEETLAESWADRQIASPTPGF